MTTRKISRRSVIRTAVGTGAAVAAGPKARVFAAPAVIQSDAVKVTWWASQGGSNGEAEQELVRRFNESQAEVKVDRVFQGTYEETAQKLAVGIQRRHLPELVTLSDVWWFRFYLNGILAPLSDYVEADRFATDDFVDLFWDEGVRKGIQYWIPMARSTPLLYYNNEALASAHLDESVLADWDTFVDNAGALMLKDGDTTTRYAFGHSSVASYNAWLFQGIIWQFKGAFSDRDFNILIDEPAGIEAGNFVRSSISDGWATATRDHVHDFCNGLTVAIMASTDSMNDIRDNAAFDWSTAYLPRKDQFGCPTGGSGLSILASAADAQKEAAFRFIEFPTSPESQLFWSQATGYIPVRTSTLDSDAMQTFYNDVPQARTAATQLPRAQPQDTARVFIPNGDQVIGGGLEQISVSLVEASHAFGEVKAILQEEVRPVIEQLKAVEG